MGRRNVVDSQELLKMFREGKNQQEIAKFFGVSASAICKRIKKLLPQPEEVINRYNLTERQKTFLLEKAKGKTSTDAVMNSYEVTSRKSAKVMGSNLMDKTEIKMALKELMELHLPQYYRIRKLRNHVDNNDSVVSLRALDLSWKLDGSYSPEKHTMVGIDLVKIKERVEQMRTEELIRIDKEQKEQLNQEENL